ncbi:brain-enriched guanylate kinase-associated protein-like isoform X2 [Anguilla rostrata]|uniref:brain-enriched guanylate kinase-associated protein-like isoform X2 n=1 Tax=Anguilla rostrata TaxID=7938 RepID=UPI0030CE1205
MMGNARGERRNKPGSSSRQSISETDSPWNSTTHSTGDIYSSSVQDQKEDLRKRLYYTTRKLELLETEFDSTRQYLETELRRAQEELEKFTDKLRRIQSGYSALQRINQELEERIQRTSQHHDDERRALSREIIVLNNHLLEAKITIEKLREDNELYRKDCNLAAQLLLCNTPHHRALKLSELPADFQERLSLHMETADLCHSPYSDSVPTTIIGQVLEKPDPGSSLASRCASPQPQDARFPLSSPGDGEGETLTRRAAYRWSDLYCSDTALYCPDERPRQRRQSVDLHGQPPLGLLWAQNSTDSNAEEDAAQASPSQEHFAEFAEFTEFVTSLQASSSYSSFSGASEEKGAHSPPSTPHHQALYANWRDSDYERKSDSSYEQDSPGFPEAHVFQQVAHAGHQNGDSGPVYARAPSCFSEPYHSPRHTPAHGGASPQLYRDVPDEEPCGRWRRLSVEDISACSYRSPGRVSPYSFSEQHFAIRPAKIKLGPLYSSFQEGADVYCSGGVLDPRFVVPSRSASASPSPERDPGGLCTQDGMPMYLAKEDSQESEHSLLFQSASSRDKESPPGSAKKEYVDISPNSSAESLNHNSLEAIDMQEYQSQTPLSKTPPPYQALGTLGLTRKDSLTKAQLYGTLLN